MASSYAYTDIAGLEAFHAATYDSVDARYTDAVVDANISQAERWVNEYCGQTFTGTIPDGVVFATLQMAKYLMNRLFLEDNHLEELPTSLKDVIELCVNSLESNKVTVTYSASSSEFHLPSLQG